MKRAEKTDFEARLAACDRPVKDHRPHKSRPLWDTYLPAAVGYAFFAFNLWILARILLP